MRFEDRNTSDRPEIEFTADVLARELHFEEAPNPEVRFPGHPERKSDWRSERENLPNEVREGVVYSNAGVRLLIASETVNKERVGTNLEHRGRKTEVQETENKKEKK